MLTRNAIHFQQHTAVEACSLPIGRLQDKAPLTTVADQLKEKGVLANLRTSAQHLQQENDFETPSSSQLVQPQNHDVENDPHQLHTRYSASASANPPAAAV